MTDERTTDASAAGGWSLSWFDVVGSLVALALFAVAQPLLDLVGRNAAFLVAHDATPADVVLVAVAVPLLLPLLLAGAVLLVKRASPAVAAGLHAALLFVLGVLLVLVVARLAGFAASAPGVLIVALALLLGGVPALAYRRSRSFRRAAGFAAFAAPVVAAMFLFASPASALLNPTPAAAVALPVPADPPPIVMVIFDELPIASLLDGNRDVDEQAFPNFARLASTSTLFRNTTSVHGQTSDAVPAALDGHYPRVEALPLAADHPRNLFALLSGDYRMHVVEPLTQLCPPRVCPAAGSEQASSRYATLARDLAVVGSHLVVPADLAEGLPPIDQGWRDFRAEAQAAGKELAFRDRFREVRRHRPGDAFNDFVADVNAGTGEPTLHFLHVLLPHSPWGYLPDGRLHVEMVERPGLDQGRWVNDEWRIAQGMQRHLLQLQLADRLLGSLLDRLESHGLYDESLVVVMADHGASFSPERSLRVIAAGTFGEIAAVPLFVKKPGQQSGRISDRPIETVDVLPTVLDVVGAPVPEGIDGRSAYDEDSPRAAKRFFGPTGVLQFPADGNEKWPFVERKERWFGGDGPFDFPYNLVPPGFESRLGAALKSPPALTGPRAVIDNASEYADLDLNADPLPALVQGTVPPAVGLGDRTPVAVGVNGQVAAVTLLEGPPDRGRFRAMVPPDLLRDGHNDISIWRLDGAEPVFLGSAAAAAGPGG